MLSPIRMSRYLTLSPDREMLDEDLTTSDGNPLTAFRMVRTDGRVLGVNPDNFFTFEQSDLGVLDDSEYDEWLEEAQNVLGALENYDPSMQPSRHGDGLIAGAIEQSGIGIRDSLVPADSAVPDGLVAQALRNLPPSDGGGYFVFAQTVDNFIAGSRVPSDVQVLSLKSKGVASVGNGVEVFVKLIEVGKANSSTSPYDDRVLNLGNERVDGRVLPICRDLSGGRYLDVKTAIDKFIPARDTDYPLAGPVTGPWLVKFMWQNGGGPMSFHHRFIADTRLDYTAGGISEHMSLCKCLELAITYDHIDIGRSAACELMCRKVQMIHDKWKHKLPNVNPTSTSSADDESFLLLGTHETRGNIGVCPELTTWLGGELGKLAMVDKERRKAREERTLALKK